MSYQKFGLYIVSSGKDLKMRPTLPGYFQFHVIHENGNLIGSYVAEEMAINLAKGLEKQDQKKLSEEIEKILSK